MDDKSKQSGAQSAEKRRAGTTQAKDAGQRDLPATGDAHGDLVERMTASHPHADGEQGRHEHTMTAQERYEAIARIAYFRAQQRSFEAGREVDDWLAAEREFEQSLQSQVTEAAAPRESTSGDGSGATAKRATGSPATKPQTDGETAPKPAARRRKSEASDGSGTAGAEAAGSASADAASAGQTPPKPAARKRKAS